MRSRYPQHYEKIRNILAGLRKQEANAPRWIKTTFGAKHVLFSSLLMATVPPQRSLSFTLEGVPGSIPRGIDLFVMEIGL